VLGVLRWAEIRRMREVEGRSIRAIARRTGHDRNAVRRALRRAGPPHYGRPSRPSKLDSFRPEIHGLLDDDAGIPGKRVLEILEGLGYEGSKTIVYD
jgi:transposase